MPDAPACRPVAFLKRLAVNESNARNSDPDRSQEGREATHTYSAQQARQGTIALKQSWQRKTFFGGLAGVVVLGVILMLVAY